MKLKDRVALLLTLAVLVLFILYQKSSVDKQIEYPVVEDTQNLEQIKQANVINKQEITYTTDGFKDMTNRKWSKMHPWDIWNDMVVDRSLTSKSDEFVNVITKMMSTVTIMEASVGYKGTQLKAMLQLDGPQAQYAVFKPKRYSRDKVLTGTPYEGYDRHNAEIAAYHLDRILGFHRAPPVVGRYVNLVSEIIPVAKKKLLSTFSKDEKGNVCFYGKCLYCNANEAACASGATMEGSLTLWLPFDWKIAKLRHPWARTYTKQKAKWEVNKGYCKQVVMRPPYKNGSRFLDIMDTSIFDFLIGNADRHHYEYLDKQKDNGMLLHLDNAKSFGNPYRDEITILAPLYQCCRLRSSTYKRLRLIDDSSSKLSTMLDEKLRGDPLYPILTVEHYEAIDRRLSVIFKFLNKCVKNNSRDLVFVEDVL